MPKGQGQKRSGAVKRRGREAAAEAAPVEPAAGGGEAQPAPAKPARPKKRRAPRANGQAAEAPPRPAEPEPEVSGNGLAQEPELFARPAPGEPEAQPAAEPASQVPATSPSAALMATAKTSFQFARAVASQAISSAGLSGALQAASALGAAMRTGLGIGGGRQVDLYGKDAELSEQLRPLGDFLYERYWRVSVVGAEHVPAGGAILVGNHSGAIPVDGPVLAKALGRERPDLPEARWLVEDQVFDTPFLGTLFNRIGAVRACPENALRLLEERRPVIVFPEGVQGIGKPFQQRYQLKRLGRGGFAKLAVRAGLPIVPVAIVGAEEALPLLAKLPTRFLGLPYLPVTLPPLPSKWTIRFGEPLAPPSSGAAASEDPAAVQPLVDGTRGAIEGMLRAILDERRSVFRG